MIYLKEFESVEAYNTFATSEDFIEPNVSMISGSTVSMKYNKDRPTPPQPSGYSTQYLTLEFLGSGNGSIKPGIDGLYYSLDNGTTWRSFNEVAVNSGNKMLIKGDVREHLNASTSAFNCSLPFNAYGNIMSIHDSENFRNLTSFHEGSDFIGLFSGTYIVSAENLILPATTLTSGCYTNMFYGCTNLTTTPELPATTLSESCYAYMFAYCTSLTTAPELPATTLAMGCYQTMFEGCTSLTTAPELPATTLADWCYQGMFYNCSSLNYIKCLATNISANYCTDYWVSGVASTGTFVKDANMSSWTTDDNGIPTNWTVQDEN